MRFFITVTLSETITNLQLVWSIFVYQGEYGLPGSKGEPGPMGDAGFPGQLGMKGEKGLFGPAGLRVSSTASLV